MLAYESKYMILICCEYCITSCIRPLVIGWIKDGVLENAKQFSLLGEGDPKTLQESLLSLECP